MTDLMCEGCAPHQPDRGWGVEMNANAIVRYLGVVSVGIATMLVMPQARADLTNPQLLSQLRPLEQLAAIANQAVYDQLTSSGTCDPLSPVPQGACTGQVFQVFSRVRELVDNSNELTQSGGPREFSLGLDIENLGFALRWTAAEELAAQGASVTQFSASQIGSLGSRLAALRFGASGFRSAANVGGAGDARTAGLGRALGGGAAADEEGIAKQWGGFIDGSFGYGNRSDTTFGSGFEDAFDFDGQEITVGVDYRLNDAFVVGLLVGHTDRAIDFDSSLSIVDARIDSDGYSTMAYALWEKGNFYVNGSVGGQWLSLDQRRRITYPSFNPLVAPIDETALGNSDSNAISATLGLGYDLRWKAFSFEPFVKAEYQDITIDGFTENSANGFDFNYGEQKLTSLETGLGFKLQYVITPSFGVLVPYLRAEYRNESRNDSRSISAVYAGIAALAASTPGVNFNLPTDQPDHSYYVASGGMSVVLKHGLQGFIEYAQVFDLEPFSDRVITGGIRVEF